MDSHEGLGWLSLTGLGDGVCNNAIVKGDELHR